MTGAFTVHGVLPDFITIATAIFLILRALRKTPVCVVQRKNLGLPEKFVSTIKQGKMRRKLLVDCLI